MDNKNIDEKKALVLLSKKDISIIDFSILIKFLNILKNSKNSSETIAASDWFSNQMKNENSDITKSFFLCIDQKNWKIINYSVTANLIKIYLDCCKTPPSNLYPFIFFNHFFLKKKFNVFALKINQENAFLEENAIPLIDESENNVCWFSCDEKEFVGVFSSHGTGALPRNIANNIELNYELDDLIENTFPEKGSFVSAQKVTNFCELLTKKGFYYYSPNSNGDYEIVAKPKNPLKKDEIDEKYHYILNNNFSTNVIFEKANKITRKQIW